jgi:hypothetical protein
MSKYDWILNIHDKKLHENTAEASEYIICEHSATVRYNIRISISCLLFSCSIWGSTDYTASYPRRWYSCYFYVFSYERESMKLKPELPKEPDGLFTRLYHSIWKSFKATYLSVILYTETGSAWGELCFYVFHFLPNILSSFWHFLSFQSSWCNSISSWPRWPPLVLLLGFNINFIPYSRVPWTRFHYPRSINRMVIHVLNTHLFHY